MNDTSCDDKLTGHYQAAFSVFMGVIAFLGRGDETLGDPALLCLFAVLMAVNLAASLALRRWPQKTWAAALITLANCAVVAAIVERSGGSSSSFWVLYLLPIFSSCLLLRGRQTALIAGGALLLDAAGCAHDAGVWGLDDTAALAVKSAVLVLAAGVTFRLASRERASREGLAEARRRVREQAALADAGLRGAGAAHDLGNALQVSLGFVDVALQAPGVPEDVLRDLATVKRSVVLAKKICEGLLRMSRSDEAPAEAEADELVRETLDLSRSQLLHARVTASFRSASAGARVLVRRTSIQRLLLNLISNAARAMDKGGELRVETAVDEACVRVTVEDTGPGLPPAILATLFQPFARGGAAGGHGLGLYLCAEAARENGGALTGENLPGGGARFTLTLASRGSAGAAVESAGAGGAAA